MKIRIALAGNPNSGKTTLFNALTGSHRSVGNWPGVTVEKKEGYLKDDGNVIITDLPGIYSLSPYTPEETAARDYLINERPDAILNIIDGTNPERNLYLTTQLAELRGQSDRNIRKVRNTIRKNLQRKLYDHLCEKSERSLTLRERQFLEEYAALLETAGRDAIIRRENKTQRRRKKAALDDGKDG